MCVDVIYPGGVFAGCVFKHAGFVDVVFELFFKLGSFVLTDR